MQTTGNGILREQTGPLIECFVASLDEGWPVVRSRIHLWYKSKKKPWDANKRRFWTNLLYQQYQSGCWEHLFRGGQSLID